MATAIKKSRTAKSPSRKGASARKPGKTRCAECGLSGRHAPSCRHAFQPSAQTDLPIEIVEGGRYWSVDDAELLVSAIVGEIVYYTIDDGDNVFTERRARFREIVERRIGDEVATPEPGPREVKTAVDGKDAAIVIDGTTGKALQPGDQATLLQTPIEDLVHQLVNYDMLITKLSSQRGSISNQLKNAKERREEIIAAIKHRDPSAPSLFAPAPDEDEFEVYNDEDDEG